MHPILKVGDIININRFEINDLKRFDIIVFWQNNQLNCHFLWATKEMNGENIYVTKSIKNPREFDVPIKASEVLGICEKKISTIRKILIYIMNII